MKRLLIIFTALISFHAQASSQNIYGSAASSIGMAVTGFYLGTYANGICGAWKTVFENSAAGSQNFVQNLELGSGAVDFGVSDCVAIRAINSLDVAVNSNAGGACVGWNGQQTFSAGQSQTAYDLNGTVIGTNAQDIARTGVIYLYFRIGGAGAVFDPHDGAALNQAVTVSATTTTLAFKFVDGAGYTPAAGSTNGILDLADAAAHTAGSCTFADSNVGFAVSQN